MENKYFAGKFRESIFESINQGGKPTQGRNVHHGVWINYFEEKNIHEIFWNKIHWVHVLKNSMEFLSDPSVNFAGGLRKRCRQVNLIFNLVPNCIGWIQIWGKYSPLRKTLISPTLLLIVLELYWKTDPILCKKDSILHFDAKLISLSICSKYPH